jgi:hypothetical protein
MKLKETKKTDKDKKPGSEMESVEKLLKKKELQTEILKKILKNNKLSDNQSL